MKNLIISEIELVASQYQAEHRTATAWRKPVVGFAAAEDPAFETLKQSVSPAHLEPSDLLPGAETVVAYFLPFEEKAAESNVDGRMASREWAAAYIDTNNLIAAVNGHLKQLIEARGYKAETTPATHNFDREKLISNWSHRHVGHIAGLGNFGLNNMLITRLGCCGRIGSFVTDLAIPADQPVRDETCLYRYDSSCSKCIDLCVNAALFSDRFDRWKCHEMCLQNEERYREMGTADVCGKCLVGLPCSFTDPVRQRSGGNSAF